VLLVALANRYIVTVDLEALVQLQQRGKLPYPIPVSDLILPPSGI